MSARGSTAETVGGRGWLPSEQQLEVWLKGQRDRVETQATEPLHQEVQELADLVDGDPVVRMYFTRMIREVPSTKRYREHHLASVDQLLQLVNAVLTMAPEYDSSVLVGCPLSAILDWAMGTPAGFAAFREPRVNAALRKILTKWATFLDSRESLYVLNEGASGWQCPQAQAETYIQEYEYDPDADHWGFASWNDFFTRRFKPGMRPVACPHDDKVIVSACEATPYAIRDGVQLHDDFWIKRQPYSLQDILANDPSVAAFVGGTVYQAFLSPLFYHRWHSPVSGTVRKAAVVQGTYFSEADSEGEDPAAGARSQGYLAHVAARALILIDADDPGIGLMCFVAVGMGEVSSCAIDPKLTPGHHVEKGEELGFFQFGGSSYCLLFRPGVIADFALQAIPRRERPDARVPVNAKIAVGN